MPSPEILIAFIVATLVLVISPGPSNLYVMARALAQGANGGAIAAVGIAAGSLFHVAAVALGLAAILSYSLFFYTTIKLMGAAYLIYLGTTSGIPKTPECTVRAK